MWMPTHEPHGFAFYCIVRYLLSAVLEHLPSKRASDNLSTLLRS